MSEEAEGDNPSITHAVCYLPLLDKFGKGHLVQRKSNWNIPIIPKPPLCKGGCQLSEAMLTGVLLYYHFAGSINRQCGQTIPPPALPAPPFAQGRLRLEEVLRHGTSPYTGEAWLVEVLQYAVFLYIREAFDRRTCGNHLLLSASLLFVLPHPPIYKFSQDSHTKPILLTPHSQ